MIATRMTTPKSVLIRPILQLACSSAFANASSLSTDGKTQYKHGGENGAGLSHFGIDCEGNVE
jgi:hypothetical protein